MVWTPYLGLVQGKVLGLGQVTGPALVLARNASVEHARVQALPRAVPTICSNLHTIEPLNAARNGGFRGAMATALQGEGGKAPSWYRAKDPLAAQESCV